MPEGPQAKLSSSGEHTHHFRAPSLQQPCRMQPVSSLYLDSSGKARTVFWSEELEKAGNERMRTAWRSAAAQTKTLTTPSASRVGYKTHKSDKGIFSWPLSARLDSLSQHRLLDLLWAQGAAESWDSSGMHQSPDGWGLGQHHLSSCCCLPFLQQLEDWRKKGYYLLPILLQGHP